MELRKLTREILSERCWKRLPVISFNRKNGRGVISIGAMRVLGLDLGKNCFVDVFQGDRPSDFYISRGNTYKIRKNGRGGAVFNCTALSALVVEKTWTVSPHINSEVIPKRCFFIVCENSVDENENKNVHALLRKKL